MTTQAIKKKRTRVTQKDIERARQELAQVKESPPTRPKAEKERKNWGKDFWYGSVYCDSYNHAWISGQQLETVYLGRADEFIPYLKGKGVDGENVDLVLIAAKEFQSEKKSYSCHLATENSEVKVNTSDAKPIVATFKKDPRFLRLLERLISQGKGIRVIHSELKSQGYEVPMRTLGRWVSKRKKLSAKQNKETGGKSP